MDSKKASSNGGIGFVGVLQIVFIVLKICNVISWSWLWVLSPLWISLGLTAIVIIILTLVSLIAKWSA